MTFVVAREATLLSASPPSALWEEWGGLLLIKITGVNMCEQQKMWRRFSPSVSEMLIGRLKVTAVTKVKD